MLVLLQLLLLRTPKATAMHVAQDAVELTIHT